MSKRAVVPEGKSFIRTGGKWVYVSQKDFLESKGQRQGFYEGGICEPGRFTSKLAPMPVNFVHAQKDGKLYKDFMRACKNPIGDVT